MKIIVTGGAGFIGSHLVDALTARGDSVAIIDDFNDYYDPALKRANLEGCPASVFETDIRDEPACRRIFSDFHPDAVIHLAARAGVRPSLENPKLYADVNIAGTLVVLEAMKAAGVRNLIFASSSSVYGNNSRVPFSETDQLDSLISPYAVTKHAGEQLCKIYAGLHGLSVSALRFFTVYGPRQRPDLAISKFVRHVHQSLPINIYGDGGSSRDYTYVADIVAGVVAALDRLSPGFRVYNIGGKHPVSLLELVRIVERVVGRPAIRRHLSMQPGDVDRTWAAIDSARRDIGYSPHTSIEDGIRAYYKWWLSEAERRVTSPAF